MSDGNEASVQSVVMRQLVRAAVKAFAELNAIRARDGVLDGDDGLVVAEIEPNLVVALRGCRRHHRRGSSSAPVGACG